MDLHIFLELIMHYPPMNRKDGTPVNAVFGFTNMLVKLIEDYREEKLNSYI